MGSARTVIKKDLQYVKFCGYGFFKNLRLFEPFILLFFIDNGLSFLQIGILYSIREITRNVLEIPAGIIADVLGRKKTMVSSFIFYLISFIVFFTGYSYAMFIAAMVLYALGDAFRTGTHKAMIFDYLKIKGWEDQKTFYYGHTRSWSQLGSALSSLIGGLLVFITGNFRDIFIYASIPYVLDLLLVASYPKSLDGISARFRKEELFQRVKDVLFGFIQSFKRMALLRSIGNLSIHTGYFRALKDYLQPVVQTVALSLPFLYMFSEKQRTAVILGIVYFFIYLLTSFMSRNSGRFSVIFKNLYRPLNITLILGIMLAGLSGFFYSQELVYLAIACFISVFLIENLRKPIGIANVSENADPKILATVLSAESQMHSLVAAVMAPLIGYFADQLGLGESLMITAVILLFLLPFIFERKKRS